MPADPTHTEGAPRCGAPNGPPTRSSTAIPERLRGDVAGWRQPRTRVAAWLTAYERAHVDAAAGAAAVLSHHTTLAGVADDLARGRVDAVLVSAARVGASDRHTLIHTLARCVRDFPDTTFAALVTEAADGRQVLAAAHLLGAAGVPALLDCRTPAGWAALRQAVAPRRPLTVFHHTCVSAVLADVRWNTMNSSATPTVEYGDGLTRFFVAVFAPDVTRADMVADRLGVAPPTLMSRCFRAGLPSPKQYVAWARLVWAARLGEAPGMSIAGIADQLDASAPQAYARSVRRLTGMSASAFRRQFTGGAMLARYRATLVTPHRDRLRTFDPLGHHAQPRPSAERTSPERAGAAPLGPAVYGRAA